MAKGIKGSTPKCSIKGCPKLRHGRGYCAMHYARWRQHGDPLFVLYVRSTKPTAEGRFWSKVNKDGPVPEYAPHLGPCWLWLAGRNAYGYGMFAKYHLAHRFSYELLVGPVPVGLELDHLCRVRSCVRSDHLEPVTHLENCRRGETGRHQTRKTHCPKGHPYNEENTKVYKGSRFCRACAREDAKRRQADPACRARRRALAAARKLK